MAGQAVRQLFHQQGRCGMYDDSLEPDTQFITLDTSYIKQEVDSNE
jgi:hypothetical protein